MAACVSGSRWIAKSKEQRLAALTGASTRQQQVRVRLLCIPPAGTGAWVYQQWWRTLPDFVEVLPIELPGRASRMRESRFTCMHALVQSLLSELAPVLQEKPYVSFGHSMGAWIAYEMAQEAKMRGLPSPAMLIVSGNRAPHLAGSQHDVDPTVMHQLSYPKFWAAFERRYGHNPDLVDNRVRLMVWPLLQADFKLVETYEGGSMQAPACPVLAIGARGDKRYTADQISAWRKHCQDFREYWVEGGHNYIIEPAESHTLLNIISNSLSALVHRHSLHQQASECS